MDATVHVFYEVAGTAGAFASASAIQRFGNNYSYFLSPIFFTCAGLIWIWISALTFKRPVKGQENDAALAVVEREVSKTNYFVAVGQGVLGFGKSIYVGAKIVFGNRAFIWLFPSYSLALYLHRFLESSLAPAYAKRVLGTSAWSQIIVGGSNFGELLGAATVFLLTDRVPTPLPWLRLDALALNIVWVLPAFSKIAKKNVTWAWIPAACFLPISYGWAAGDVSLAAYIQHTLSEMDLPDQGVSPLGAVMALLYASYIVFNAVLSSVLGKVIDRDFTAHKNIVGSLQRVGGIQFSVCCGIILLATLIPRGAFSLNPKAIGNDLDGHNHVNVLDGAVLKHGGDTSLDAEKNANSPSIDDEEKPVYRPQA